MSLTPAAPPVTVTVYEVPYSREAVGSSVTVFKSPPNTTVDATRTTPVVFVNFTVVVLMVADCIFSENTMVTLLEREIAEAPDAGVLLVIVGRMSSVLRVHSSKVALALLARSRTPVVTRIL